MRIFDLKKEVINICDCKKLGFVGDVEFNPENGCITHLIVLGPGCLCGILARRSISFRFRMCQIGDDIILVEVKKPKTKMRLNVWEEHNILFYKKEPGSYPKRDRWRQMGIRFREI